MRDDAYPRALEFHQMLKQGRPVTAADLQERFETSYRTAQRVVAYLRDTLRAPLEFDHKLRTYYYSDPAFELPQVIMTEGEAVALIVAHEVLAHRMQSPLTGHLLDGLEKLKGLMPDSVTVQAGEILDGVSVVPHPARPILAGVLESVTYALEHRRRLHIDYYTAGRNCRGERDIDPYHLTQRFGDWYVVAFCHKRGQVLTFALSRIHSVKKLDTRYTIPPDFSPQTYFEAAMGVENGAPRDVELVFDAFQARWVRERCWHPTQVMTDLADGGLLLKFRVSMSTELKQWILSYGAHVRVEEPLELAREIADEHQRALVHYPRRKPVTRMPAMPDASDEAAAGDH